MASDTSLVFNILAKDKASAAFGKVKVAAAAAFAVGAAAAVGFGKAALDAGAGLEAAMGATRQVFGGAAQSMLDWSKTTSRAFGISRADALAAGKDFGAFFTAIGVAPQAAATLSQEWVTMSANMAAFRDVNPTQALEAMQSALRGEMDPLQQFIPSINAAAIEQRALAMTGKTTTSALTQQEKALAINALMMESTANKAGAAELAQNGFGVQTAKVKARIEDTTAAIGQKLLPVALNLTNWALGAISWMTKHKDIMIPLVAVIGSLAGIIAIIIGVYKLWTIAQTALNIVMMLNPIGLIVLGIMILIGVIVLIATKTTWFQTAWNTVWGGVKAVTGAVVDWIVSKWHALVGFVTGLPGRISAAASGMWDGIKNAFRAAINWIIGKWNNLSFSIPSVDIPGLGKVGGATFSTPDIPFLARGGIVTGPTLAVLGESGPEMVTPLNGRSGVSAVTLEINSGGSALDDALVEILRKAVRVRGGNVQLVLGRG